MAKYNVMQTKKTQEAVDAILEKAQHDKAFRELTLSNPRQAIKQETGVDLPADFTIRTVANGGADMTVVVPDYSDPNAELSESDLENVAGGAASWCGIDCGVADIGVAE